MVVSMSIMCKMEVYLIFFKMAADLVAVQKRTSAPP